MIGSWSDKYGRKPFLIIAFSTASLPLLVILLHLQFGVSMLFYFPAQVIITNTCHVCCKIIWAVNFHYTFHVSCMSLACSTHNFQTSSSASVLSASVTCVREQPTLFLVHNAHFVWCHEHQLKVLSKELSIDCTYS